MEDTYEKNLGQKSSLTTSDFIRVVGSDNVSYKQQVSNVKDAFGLAVYHIEYAETASTSGTRYYSPSISGAIDSIAAKGAGRYMVECIRNTSYSDTYSNITSSNMTFIVDVLGASYINVIGIQLNNSTSVGDIILKRAKSPTWGDWIKMPTRAEIDALNSKTTQVLTPSIAPNGSVRVSKVGSVVTLHSSLSGIVTSGQGWYDICTLPNGFAPNPQVDTVGADNNASGSSDTAVQIRITTAGLVRFYSQVAKSNYAPYFCITYII